jgi:hypothetical protein
MGDAYWPLPVLGGPRASLPAISEKRAVSGHPVLAALDGLCRLLEAIESDIYPRRSPKTGQ